MPFEAIVSRRLYRQVADQLREMFDSGEYAVGSRLPPERELAERMGVSRPTVREALIALEVGGRVRIRVGSGIYVTRPDQPEKPAAQAAADGPFDCLSARSLIESAICEEAALRISLHELAEIDEILLRMSLGAHAYPVWIALDREFHIAVAGCVGNPVLAQTVAELFDKRSAPHYVRLNSFFEDQNTWLAAYREHCVIRDALANGDATAARNAMRAHLNKAQERLSASFEDITGGGERETASAPAVTSADNS